MSLRRVYVVKELRENLVKCVEESGRFDTCLFIGMKIHYARSRFACIDSSLCNRLSVIFSRECPEKIASIVSFFEIKKKTFLSSY